MKILFFYSFRRKVLNLLVLFDLIKKNRVYHKQNSCMISNINSFTATERPQNYFLTYAQRSAWVIRCARESYQIRIWLDTYTIQAWILLDLFFCLICRLKFSISLKFFFYLFTLANCKDTNTHIRTKRTQILIFKINKQLDLSIGIISTIIQVIEISSEMDNLRY